VARFELWKLLNRFPSRSPHIGCRRSSPPSPPRRIAWPRADGLPGAFAECPRRARIVPSTVGGDAGEWHCLDSVNVAGSHGLVDHLRRGVEQEAARASPPCLRRRRDPILRVFPRQGQIHPSVLIDQSTEQPLDRQRLICINADATTDLRLSLTLPNGRRGSDRTGSFTNTEPLSIRSAAMLSPRLRSPVITQPPSPKAQQWFAPSKHDRPTKVSNGRIVNSGTEACRDS
jgi:hypothetical protein